MDFYYKHYRNYFNSTVDIDPTSFLTPLKNILKPGASVFDVGCGSGRDLLWMSRQGFLPTGFEFSPGLAALAEKHSRCPVILGDFNTYDFSVHEFDALILIGSLVHVSPELFPTKLLEISKSLVKGGFILVTMKEGVGEYCTADGRIFFLWEAFALEDIFQKLNLHVVDMSRQRSNLPQEDQWLGYLLRKKTAHFAGSKMRGFL